LLGVDTEHLPAKPPFVSSDRTSRPNNLAKMSISNTSIVAALQSSDAFYELYTHTTNRAISLYTKSGRKKFALKLHGSLAALDLSVSIFVNFL
jgi:trafficking protein particle complex subunit 10